MRLALYQDQPSSETAYQAFANGNLLERLRALDSRARRKGLESLDPEKNPLIGLGMETDQAGRVTKNSYGVFNLAWQAEAHPEWAEQIEEEVREVRRRIRESHGVTLRYVVWAGMGGSAEDKSMYIAARLIKGTPRFFVLDSTDPAKLAAILEELTDRGKRPLPEALRQTLVVGMALGMTSYEPVVNLEKLALLYERNGLDSTANFLYLTMEDSLLDRFGKSRGYRRVEMQLDGRNGTSGRHSGPLTRGSLYPLALARVDIAAWMAGTRLDDEEVRTAWRLASFLRTQSREGGRPLVTLLLPKGWEGAAIWTKQDFEESLGKSEEFGIKIVVGEAPKLVNYRPPKDPAQNRCFLAVQLQGKAAADGQKIPLLRRSGYPLAVLTLSKANLSHYMQFMHYVVFGIGYLERMNFVTQPSVELYKAITNRLHESATAAGGIEKTAEWKSFSESERRTRFAGGLVFHHDQLPADVELEKGDAARQYASLLRQAAGSGAAKYGELTFFGDTRYSAGGRAMRKVLDRAAERVFRGALKMPVDVYEGPAMNHSYHEMIIGHGGCVSTVILSRSGAKLAEADYTADYHRAQFLATQMALAARKRLVVAITVKDLEAGSLEALDGFFRQAAQYLKARRGSGVVYS